MNTASSDDCQLVMNFHEDLPDSPDLHQTPTGARPVAPLEAVHLGDAAGKAELLETLKLLRSVRQSVPGIFTA